MSTPCMTNRCCRLPLFSLLLFSIDWIIFFFAPGCFCKQGVKTRPTVRTTEQNWTRGSSWLRRRKEGDWEWKCDQCVVDVFRGKANYPQKVNQVPGLKCEGAACSNGLDIRNADRLEKFSFQMYRTFSFKNRAMCWLRELSPAAEAPCHHLCPADFFWSQNLKYKQLQPHARIRRT